MKKWLAYKHLVGRPVYLDTERDGWGGWPAKACNETCLLPLYCFGLYYSGVLWHQTAHSDHIDRNRHTTQLWHYGQGEGDSRNYNTFPRPNCGVIESPSVNLTSATSAFLSFWSWYQTNDNESYDKKLVQISTDGGSNWVPLKQILRSQGNPPGDPWQQILIDLSSYAGQPIKIRFKFDTCNCIVNNNYNGWYIGDVVISGAFPVDKATLMVRVTEGATLKFTTSGTGNTTPIKDGDIVIQGAVRGTVVGDPILESGSWAGGNAAGIMILNKVFGTF
ncbi:MAG: immune inhibitor A [Desulfobacterales bacterium]|nr:immune inhibitor A [Desulfobacterales bacterium]